MRIIVLLISLLLLAAPAAFGHNPPAPTLSCQTDGTYHDYFPPSTGQSALGRDGNLADCPPSNSVEAGPGVCLDPVTTGVPFVCDPASTGVEQPLADYDGELDHGYGGVVLFYETGDGETSGVTACHGEPSVGHHAGGISALDMLGNGPSFIVTSDFSRAGLEETPDCGDGLLEPCDPTPPTPSTWWFPVNVVLDTVDGALYSVFGPGGEGCNAFDNSGRADTVVGGPSYWAPTFGPGAAGSLVVFIEQDTNTPVLATAGHVWADSGCCMPPPPPHSDDRLRGPGPLVVTVTWNGVTTADVEWSYDGSFTCVPDSLDYRSFVIRCRPENVIEFHCVNPGVAVLHSQGAPYGRTRVDLDCGTITGGCEVWHIGSCVQYLGSEQWDVVVCRGGYDIVPNGQEGTQYPPRYEVACYSDPPQMPQPPVPLTVGGSPP